MYASYLEKAKLKGLVIPQLYPRMEGDKPILPQKTGEPSRKLVNKSATEFSAFLTDLQNLSQEPGDQVVNLSNLLAEHCNVYYEVPGEADEVEEPKPDTVFMFKETKVDL